MSADTLAFCRQHLRDNDRDMYLASLLYPSDHAAGLTAIDAFDAEINRIRGLVSEPLPGEIRLQWWRDALSGSQNGASSNPIAAALLAACDVYDLDRPLLDKAFLARAFDLYDDPMPDQNTLEGYAGETCSSLFVLKAKMIGIDHDGALADAAGYAGVACTMMRRLQSFAQDRARGQLYVPLDLLAEHGLTRDALMQPIDDETLRRVINEFGDTMLSHHSKALIAVEKLPKPARVVFKPLALAPLYAKAVKRPATRLLQERITISPLRAQWALWRF